MTEKAWRHQLTGVVSLGQYNNDMQKIKTGKAIAECEITSFIDALLAAEYIKKFCIF